MKKFGFAIWENDSDGPYWYIITDIKDNSIKPYSNTAFHAKIIKSNDGHRNLCEGHFLNRKLKDFIIL